MAFEAKTAKTKLEELLGNVAAEAKLADANEATTRVRLIDRILEQMGWAPQDLGRETSSGAGSFLDYELHVGNEPWMVVEAKRIGATFVTDPSLAESGVGGLVSLRTLTRKGTQELRDALKQAAGYCNSRGIPLAAVTNGKQWVFFRGLSAPRQPWTDSVALTFFSGAEILERFDDFVAALGRTTAGSAAIFNYIDRNAPAAPPIPTMPRDLLRIVRPQPDAARMGALRAASDLLLGDIVGDARSHMLEYCYIEPGIEADFERSIQRLLRDTAQPIDTSEEHLFDGDTERFITEVSARDALGDIQHPVVVVGHVGAGKTTFLHRSIARLREDRSAICVLVDLEGYHQGGAFDTRAEEDRIATAIIDKLRNAAVTVLKHRSDLPEAERELADIESVKTLRQLFHRELKREKELGAALWNSKPEQWAEKEYSILGSSRSNPRELLWRYIKHLSNRFKRAVDQLRYPILIIVDNLDQAADEYQRAVYGFTQRLARETNAVAVICIREDTFHRGREPGGFLTSSPLPFVFHVAAPAHDKLLRQRVRFGETIAKAGATAGTKVPPAVILDACDLIRDVFLPHKSESLELVACLSGSNIRESLGLVRSIVLGSTVSKACRHSGAAYALECLLAFTGAENLRSRQLLFNLLDAEPTTPPNHMLLTRLLSYFQWATTIGPERPLAESTDQVVGRFAAWGYPVGIVRSNLGALLGGGMLKPFNESERGRVLLPKTIPARVTLTASGYAHLTKLLQLTPYRAVSACNMRWYDPRLAHEFIGRSQSAGPAEGPSIDDIVASRSLSLLDSYLAQMAAAEDEQLVVGLENQAWIREVKAATGRLVQVSRLPGDLGAATPAAPTKTVSLVRLPSSAIYKGSTMIPRILWALEHLAGTGLQDAEVRDIAYTLYSELGHNISHERLHREVRGFRKDSRARGLWTTEGGRLRITDAGRVTLAGLLEENAA